ncbi:hypothetical protein ACVC7T_09390 [Streptococcus sp. P25B114]|uniref:hypothetical protein n=1 Tax=Streptococcus TaxID=1301 RepID=UPI000CF5542C|nr:hypothetical protein [Streptococcus suis]MBY4986907.1 hypothetical protein [Streptococcus suis]MBY5040035.1 hypothetical protein [Streptococcus suis]TQE81230.1 hypothetical protein FH688_01510 [Streptococcus suis]HEM3460151.1 hypothetical protein [Streptococcus suis]HEM4633513.1 hypothetical protein [Streptococcus suis]
MTDEVLIEEIVSIIVDVEMKCKKFLLLNGHCIDVVSDYYYSDEDCATISFSRNNDKLTIRFDNQQCIVTVENEIFTVTSEVIEEGIEIQIEILIKQAILGKWKMFMNDVKNNSLFEAIQKHRFDDYSSGPDSVIYY